MTRKEMFAKAMNEVTSVELIDFFKNEINKIDEANARKKSKASLSKAIEDKPIIEAIVNYLTGRDFTLASDIASACGVTTQKVQGVIKKIDNIEVTDVKVAKVGIRKAYRLTV